MQKVIITPNTSTYNRPCNLECSMELSKLNTSDNSTGKLTPQSIQNGINTTAQAQTLLGAQGTHKDTVTHAPS